MKMLVHAAAADVLQPDVLWAGGITKPLKICALALTYDAHKDPRLSPKIRVPLSLERRLRQKSNTKRSAT